MDDAPFRNLSMWRRLWASERPGREHAMEEADRALYAALPEEVEVHRGFTYPGMETGMAWTLDRERWRSGSLERTAGVRGPRGRERNRKGAGSCPRGSRRAMCACSSATEGKAKW